MSEHLLRYNNKDRRTKRLQAKEKLRKKKERTASQSPAPEVNAVQQEQAAKKAKQQQGAGDGQMEHVEDGTPGAASGRQRSRSNVSLVAPELGGYLTEIIQHFHSLGDDEERQLLLGNVLEEIAGKEMRVTADPACSRHIETLLGIASPAQLIGFLRAILDMGGLFEVAVR